MDGRSGRAPSILIALTMPSLTWQTFIEHPLRPRHCARPQGWMRDPGQDAVPAHGWRGRQVNGGGKSNLAMLTEPRTRGNTAQAWGSGGERGASRGRCWVWAGSPKPGGSWSSDTGVGGVGSCQPEGTARLWFGSKLLQREGMFSALFWCLRGSMAVLSAVLNVQCSTECSVRYWARGCSPACDGSRPPQPTGAGSLFPSLPPARPARSLRSHDQLDESLVYSFILIFTWLQHANS